MESPRIKTNAAILRNFFQNPTESGSWHSEEDTHNPARTDQDASPGVQHTDHGTPLGDERGSHLVTIRASGTSTSSTPRKVKRSLTKYFGGSSETWRTIVPTASVTAAWKTTEPTCMPARFTRTC